MHSLLLVCAAAATVAAAAAAQAKGASGLMPVPIQDVTIDDPFWSPKLRLWREVTLLDCLGKLEKDGVLGNFDKVRDGRPGEHAGPPWYDGLTYETIRAAGDFLASRRDPAIEDRVDEVVDHVAAAAARDPDGYVNTYTQLIQPDHRWGMNGGDDNWQHDCYNAGAMVEAGVHYYRATGKTKLLATAVRLANHMCDVMGPVPRHNVVPGHSIAEEAVVRLYELFREQPGLKAKLGVPVDEERYLRLAEFWIENRGNHEGRKDFGSYGQDHKPVLQQETIEGHAVRATLLCTGLVAAAHADGRQDYLAAARRLWENMAGRRMYVTGGLGAVAGHEGFGPDYDLPNTGYLETCAAVGAGFFHRNLNLATGEARYADELERVLYNGVLAGAGLSGTEYFYENPLDAGPQHRRWAWHPCPCCPPMFLKMVSALPGYVYARGADGLTVNLFVGSQAQVDIAGARLTLTQTTRYPWEGDVRIALAPEHPTDFTLSVRIPGWCHGAAISVNGRRVRRLQVANGYARVRRTWQPGDTVDLHLPMPVERVKAHPRVDADAGRVALMRGPVVYCLEGCDNPAGVRSTVLSPGGHLDARWEPDLLGGVVTLHGKAAALGPGGGPEALYRGSARPATRPVDVKAVPYYANANRQPCDMIVWVADTPARAMPAPR